jgi:hypothetical protein
MDPTAGPSVPAWRRVARRLLSDLRRTTRATYEKGIATPEERAFLADASRVPRVVEGPQAQDYLSWRRSGLTVATVFLGITALLATIDFIGETSGEEAASASGLQTLMVFLLYAAKVVLFLACVASLLAWHAVLASHRRLRLGWWIGFAIPFVVALIPFTALLPETEVSAEAAGLVELQRTLLALIGAVVWFLLLMPTILAVFAGAVRAAVAVKQFAPEAAVPGWIAVVASPMLCVLSLVLFVLLHQLGGNVLLALGFFVLALGLLQWTLFGRRVARPHSREELESVLSPIRRRSVVLCLAGVGMIVVAGFAFDFLPRVRLFGWTSEGALLSVWTLVQLGLELYGRALFTTVLFADLIVLLLRHAWNESQAFRVSALAAPLESKVRQLEAGGLAEIHRSSSPPAAAPPAAAG